MDFGIMFSKKTIKADEGKILFKDDLTSFEVVLGKNDNPDNWSQRDMTKEEIYNLNLGIANSAGETIAELKEQLSATDYKAIKFFEGWISEEDYAPVKALRQALRERINMLERTIRENA